MLDLGKSRKQIGQNEAKKLLEENKDIVLIDVRESGEFRTGHLDSAINIPLNTLGLKIREYNFSKDSTIFVYCLSGIRSGNAVDILNREGYRNVYNIGGIATWPF